MICLTIISHWNYVSLIILVRLMNYILCVPEVYMFVTELYNYGQRKEDAASVNIIFIMY